MVRINRKKKKGLFKKSRKRAETIAILAFVSVFWKYRANIRHIRQKGVRPKDLCQNRFFDLGHTMLHSAFSCRFCQAHLLVMVFIQVKSDGNQRKLQNNGFYTSSSRSFVGTVPLYRAKCSLGLDGTVCP